MLGLVMARFLARSSGLATIFCGANGELRHFVIFGDVRFAFALNSGAKTGASRGAARRYRAFPMSKTEKPTRIETPQAIRGTQDIFGADAEAFAHVVETFERVRKPVPFPPGGNAGV
jgi:hypothetical protein